MMGSEEEPGIIKQALTEIFNTIENVSLSFEMYFNPRGIQIYSTSMHSSKMRTARHWP